MNAADFEQYRYLLFSIAYRMLGSAMDAEDMVQETYLRYQKNPPENLDSPKAYLSKIITRLCLDQLKSAKTQREQYIGQWLPEPVITQNAPDALLSQHESISMAFLMLLEHLNPLERAVFLLREVFEYSYPEIAQQVGKTEAHCRQAYHRAKTYLVERRPRFEPTSADQQKLLLSFMQAVNTGNIAELTHLLSEEVVVYGDGGGKVFASPHPIMGRELVIRLFLGAGKLLPKDVQVQMSEVNGSWSIIFWHQSKIQAILNFVIADNQICQIHNVMNPDKLVYAEQHPASN